MSVGSGQDKNQTKSWNKIWDSCQKESSLCLPRNEADNRAGNSWGRNIYEVLWKYGNVWSWIRYHVCPSTKAMEFATQDLAFSYNWHEHSSVLFIEL